MAAVLTPNALADTIRGLPGPQSAARPVTPARIATTLVAPLLCEFGYEMTELRTNQLVYDLTIAQSDGRCVDSQVQLCVVAPGQFVWTDDTHLTALASRTDDAGIGIVTDGYRWQVGTWNSDTTTVTRVYDIDLRPAWKRLQTTPETAGYIRQSARRASVATLQEWLHATAVKRRSSPFS